MTLCKAILLFILTMMTTAHAATPLRPPAGFSLPPQAAATLKTKFTCPDAPAPFTGPLDFHSKYEGSDSARATLNPEADRAFREGTRQITELEKQVVQETTRYQRDGDVRHVACVADVLNTWAQADALTAEAVNHTGKSMRKWALASLSSAWLQLQYAPTQPLKAMPQQARATELWLGRLADLTVKDWADLPLKKVNNHSYWAAWALISSAVVTQRQDLFDHAMAIYRTAMSQVDGEGFLENELRRKQRAFSYHNYVIQPLVAIALFARANGVDVTRRKDDGLYRLGRQIIQSLDNPQAFTDRAGEQQDIDFISKPGNLAWLEGWCSLYTCDNALHQRIERLRPLQYTRLGGDVTRLFAETALK